MHEELLKERVDPKQAALIVVDVQNDFVHPEGAIGKRALDTTMSMNMIPRLQKLIDGAHAAGVPVIFIRTEHGKWTNSKSWVIRKGNVAGPPICQVGTWGCEYYKVSPDVDDFVVIKHRYSAFQDTDLDLVLRSIGVESILCTGVATNVCVESTARQGYMLDYNVVFVEDCCGTTTKEEHEATLLNINLHFGIVATCDHVLKVWGVI
ncbi:MAG: cysteine hydrolase [Candidatus Tectomicrobia bacterium]|nr:cysteine hydrolase [Candidatus Tectomicrobia bacterium]